MKLTDRLMSWLGYVPAERLTECVCTYVPVQYVAGDEPGTFTTVKTPGIMIATDFKRNKLCS